MDLNTDVICNYSGEILMEGVLLASAHIYVAKKGGKIIKDEVQSYELDEIDCPSDSSTYTNVKVAY